MTEGYSGSSGQHEFDAARRIYFKLGGEWLTKRPTMPEERKRMHPLYMDHAHLLSAMTGYQAAREAHGLDKQKDLYRSSGRSPLEILTGNYGLNFNTRPSGSYSATLSSYVATDALTLYSRANGGSYISPDLSGGYLPSTRDPRQYQLDQGPLY